VDAAFFVFGLVLGILLISQFWTLANDVYDPRQARRIFGFIGGGASLGGAMGAGLTTWTVIVGVNNLLLVSAASIAACVAIVTTIVRRQPLLHADAPVASGKRASERRGRSPAAAVPHLQIISKRSPCGDRQRDHRSALNMAAAASETTDAGLVGFLAEVTFHLSPRASQQVGLDPSTDRPPYVCAPCSVGLGATAVAILMTGALASGVARSSNARYSPRQDDISALPAAADLTAPRPSWT
jgi:hypothetical protein